MKKYSITFVTASLLSHRTITVVAEVVHEFLQALSLFCSEHYMVKRSI